MLRNYFLTALRNIIRRPFFSLVNITGLSLGMAATLLLFQYVFVEQSYDAHIPEAERVFRLYDKGENSSATTPPLLATLIREKFPQTEAVARVMPSHGTMSFEQAYRAPIRLEDKELLYAEAGFPKMFGLKMAMGSGDIRRAACMLVSEKWALGQFGGVQEALGQRVLFEDQFGEESYVITGIFEDVPGKSHLQFEVLLNFQALMPTRFGWDDINGLGWAAFYTYIKLKKADGAKQMEDQMADLRTELEGEASTSRLTLQPLQEIHLTPGIAAEPSPTRSPNNLYLLLSLGGFILVIAWLNFVNLSTARATERAREVGVRKTIGAHRSHLIGQFLIESSLLFGIATLLAMLIAELSLPAFSQWSGQVSKGHILADPRLLLSCLALFAGGSLAAGAYPAFILSAYKPVDVLKGRLREIGKGLSLRRSLVVLQFVISGVLMIGAFAVYHQLDYMLHAQLGLDVSEKLIVWGPDRTTDDPAKESQVFMDRLGQMPGINAISSAGNVPGIGFNFASSQIKRPQTTDPTKPGLSVLYVDESFQQILGLELVAGRNFDPELDDQVSGVLINQSALGPLGFSSPAEAINQPLQFPYEEKPVFIRGVIQDYHHFSLHKAYNPALLRYERIHTRYYILDIQTRSLGELITQVERQFQEVFPGNAFEYQFMDAVFEAQYRAERRLGSLIGVFAGLAVLVAGLGLLGLLSFSMARRRREIGIRRILGANLGQMVRTLGQEFIGLVGIAMLVTIPLGWWGTQLWLERYPFRFEIGLQLFLWPCLAMILLAVGMITLETRRRLRQNPIDALRHE